MGKKCEWKDGKFYLCSNAMREIVYLSYPGYIFTYCPFCGADIRKPEPEVIIKRSGETWVALYDEVDYLALHPGYKNSTHGEMIGYFKAHIMDLNNPKGEEYFKPISEIKITDEVAKLSPMVVIDGKDNNVRELLRVKNNISIHFDDFLMAGSSFTMDIRLATVKDLS